MLKIGGYSFHTLENWDSRKEPMPNEIREYLANAIHDFKLDINSFKDEYNAIFKKYNGYDEEFWEAICKSKNNDMKVWAVLSYLCYYTGNGWTNGGSVEAKDYGSPSNDKANLSGNMKIKFLDKDKEGLCSIVYTYIGFAPIDTGEDQYIKYVMYNMPWDEQYAYIRDTNEEYGFANNPELVARLNKARLYKELAFFVEPYPTYIDRYEEFDGQGFGVILRNCIYDSAESGDWLLTLAGIKTALNNGYFNCSDILSDLANLNKPAQVKDFLLKHGGYNILNAFSKSELDQMSEKDLANMLPNILSYVPYAPYRCDTKFNKVMGEARGKLIPRYPVSNYFTSDKAKKVLDYGLHGAPKDLGISAIHSISTSKLGVINKALTSIRKLLTTSNEFANSIDDGISCKDWSYVELHNYKLCDGSGDILNITSLYLYKKDGDYHILNAKDFGSDYPSYYDENSWNMILSPVKDLIDKISALFGNVESIMFPVEGDITCGTVTKSVQEKGSVHVLLGR